MVPGGLTEASRKPHGNLTDFFGNHTEPSRKPHGMLPLSRGMRSRYVFEQQYRTFFQNLAFRVRRVAKPRSRTAEPPLLYKK